MRWTNQFIGIDKAIPAIQSAIEAAAKQLKFLANESSFGEAIKARVPSCKEGHGVRYASHHFEPLSAPLLLLLAVALAYKAMDTYLFLVRILSKINTSESQSFQT